MRTGPAAGPRTSSSFAAAEQGDVARLLAGGRATISTPLSRMFSSSSRTMSACPPPNRSRKSVRKCPRTVSRVSANSRRLSALIFSMIRCNEFFALVRSFSWPERVSNRDSSWSSSSRASKLTLPRLLIFRRSSSISCWTRSRCCSSSPAGFRSSSASSMP